MSIRINIPYHVVAVIVIIYAMMPLYAVALPMDTPTSSDNGTQANASNADILQLIRSKFVAPVGSAHTAVTTKVTITVNTQGYVTSVYASSNNAYDQAAVEAIRAVGRFPIDSSDPKYPTFTIIFRGHN